MDRAVIMRTILGTMLGLGAAWSVQAALTFNHTVTGELLDLDQAREEGRDTPAVKSFLETGTNPYNENPSCLPKGEELFLTACSACHGHLAEGKVGPGLNDDYWTYPKNETDKGLFETIFGGAQGQMGPQYGALTLDEMLLTMAWVRHLYTGDPKDATWLDKEQRAKFERYSATKEQQASAETKALECEPVPN